MPVLQIIVHFFSSVFFVSAFSYASQTPQIYIFNLFLRIPPSSTYNSPRDPECNAWK